MHKHNTVMMVGQIDLMDNEYEEHWGLLLKIMMSKLIRKYSQYNKRLKRTQTSRQYCLFSTGPRTDTGGEGTSKKLRERDRESGRNKRMFNRNMKEWSKIHRIKLVRVWTKTTAWMDATTNNHRQSDEGEYWIKGKREKKESTFTPSTIH